MTHDPIRERYEQLLELVGPGWTSPEQRQAWAERIANRLAAEDDALPHGSIVTSDEQADAR